MNKTFRTLLEKEGQTPMDSSHGHASVGQPTRTYLQQFCTDTGCSLEDPLEAMDDKDE